MRRVEPFRCQQLVLTRSGMAAGSRFRGFGEFRCAEEFNTDEGFVALNPGVMPWWNGVGIAPADADPVTVRGFDAEGAGNTESHMVVLA